MFFGDKHRVLWEPSFLLQYVDKTKEKHVNIKAYKNVDFDLFKYLSYRRSLDQARYTNLVVQQVTRDYST
jgi:hypothetical protein